MNGAKFTHKTILNKGTILVVEDSDDDFEIFNRVTTKLKISNPVLRCRSGSEAWNFLLGLDDADINKKFPVIILLDLSMPGLNGRKLLAMIKSNAKIKHIPVIIVTSSVNENDIESCYRSGANSYLQKPLDFDDYLKLMKCFNDYWLSSSVLPLYQHQ